MSGYQIEKLVPDQGENLIPNEPIGEIFVKLSQAKAKAEELANLTSDEAWWNCLNDGIRPGNHQIYQLHHTNGTWTGYCIRGPHVDYQEKR